MDPFELLKADHKKVAELFDRLEAASGKAKLGVFKQIKSELDLHTHIEEKILYPALEKPRGTHDLTLEAYEEHKVVKTLLAELAGAKTASDEWQAKAKVLRENVEHHVKEEENELFKKADGALTDEELEALGNRMAAEKARKQGRPAPKSSKPSSGKPGILSKIADFVGLGVGTPSKKVAKKAPKKSAASKGARASANSRATRKAGKSATAAKRSSATKGTKKTAKPSRSAATKKSAGAKKSGPKSAKKRASRK